MRRVGVLLPATADDAEFQTWVGAFLQELQKLGWSIGRNVRIDTRWATGNAGDIRKHAAELAALAPDVILAHGASSVGPLLQATHTVPIVFPIAGDPVGAGFVDSLARPGGNATGFMSTEYSMSGKRLELLKETAPGVTRAAVLRDPTQGSGTSLFAVRPAVAPSLRVEVNPINMRDAAEIERAVTAFARSPGGGLIVAASPVAASSRSDRHAGGSAQAARGLLERFFVAAGGLMSYGADFSTSTGVPPATSIASSRARSRPTCQCRRRPSIELVINLKTAKALGLTIPPAATRPRRRGDRIAVCPMSAISPSGQLSPIPFLPGWYRHTIGTRRMASPFKTAA